MSSKSSKAMVAGENLIWVVHPTLGYAPARILQEQEGVIQVATEDGWSGIVHDRAQCGTVHKNSLVGVPNLLDLGEFSMPALLHNVRVRYERGEFYSSIGLPILISVNPYKPLPHLYDAATRRKYQLAAFHSTPATSRSPTTFTPSKRQYHDDASTTSVPRTSSSSITGTPPSNAAWTEDGPDRKLFIDRPHLFGTAQVTYSALVRTKRAQSIVISGESGAGKTEATKILLKYFSELDERDNSIGTMPTNGNTHRGTDTSVEVHTLRSNPILEAFGNAKTVRNDNSSRFGKFIRIFFDLKNPKRVKSARISHYLLEKCRLVSLHSGERNFHVFYALLFGSLNDPIWSKRICDEWHLRPSLKAHSKILGNSPHDWIVNNEEEMFRELIECLRSINFSESQIEDIFGLVGGLIHLSSVRMEPDARATPHSDGARLCQLVDRKPLELACQLLRLSRDENPTVQGQKTLHDVLLTKCVRNAEGQGSWIRSGRDLEHAHHIRDAIIKEVYSRLFSWIVKQINNALAAAQDDSSEPSYNLDAIKKRGDALDRVIWNRKSSFQTSNLDQIKPLRPPTITTCTPPIGLLDIYGFEVFEGRNSFEQLCINFANEKLQQHFNLHVLALEQKTYKSEDIDWSEITFTDNKEIIRALEEAPHGVFVILDDARVTDKNRDNLFLNQIESSAIKSVVSLPPIKRLKQNVFTVRHYAGEVEYNCTGFVDKNVDKLELQCSHFISRTTSSPILQQLFPREDFDDLTCRRNSLKATESVEFRNQLDCLLASLTATTPTYVRCIKPNPEKRPNNFHSLEVLRQLEYAGLLESIRIRNSGFGVRCSFQDFLEDYACTSETESRLFWARRGLYRDNEMKDSCWRILNGVAPLQRGSQTHTHSRWRLGKTKVFMKEDVQILLEKNRTQARTKATTLIQSFWRGTRARCRVRRILKSIVRFQAHIRRLVALDRVKRIRAANYISSWWRNVRPARRAFHQKLAARRAAIVIQRATRQTLLARSRSFPIIPAAPPAPPLPPPSAAVVQDPISTAETLPSLPPPASTPFGGSQKSRRSTPTPPVKSPRISRVSPRNESRSNRHLKSGIRGARVAAAMPADLCSDGSDTTAYAFLNRSKRSMHRSNTCHQTDSQLVDAVIKTLLDQTRKADREKSEVKKLLEDQLAAKQAQVEDLLVENEEMRQQLMKFEQMLNTVITGQDTEMLRQNQKLQLLMILASDFDAIVEECLAYAEERQAAPASCCEFVRDCLIFFSSTCKRGQDSLRKFRSTLSLPADQLDLYIASGPLELTSNVGDGPPSYSTGMHSNYGGRHRLAAHEHLHNVSGDVMSGMSMPPEGGMRWPPPGPPIHHDDGGWGASRHRYSLNSPESASSLSHQLLSAKKHDRITSVPVDATPMHTRNRRPSCSQRTPSLRDGQHSLSIRPSATSSSREVNPSPYMRMAGKSLGSVQTGEWTTSGTRMSKSVNQSGIHGSAVSSHSPQRQCGPRVAVPALYAQHMRQSSRGHHRLPADNCMPDNAFFSRLDAAAPAVVTGDDETPRSVGRYYAATARGDYFAEGRGQQQQRRLRQSIGISTTTRDIHSSGIRGNDAQER